MNSTQLELPDFLDEARTPLPCTNEPCLFHADDDTQIETAKDMCVDCPLMFACRDWARAHREAGIWGGETEEERAAAGYRPKAQPGGPSSCGTPAGARWHRRHGGKPCVACGEAERAAKRAYAAGNEARLMAAWPPKLSDRERRVLADFAAGFDRRQISERQQLGRHGLKKCTYRLRLKLRAPKAADHELPSFARAAGAMPADSTDYRSAA